MNPKYMVALDQGTTSSRAVIFDRSGSIVASHAIEFPQIYPQPGWVEHDPFDILQSQRDALRIAVQKAGIAPSQIHAIGITNQRETALLWDRATGKPVMNAIVWQCRRTAPLCDALRAQNLESDIRARTGLTIDAYFAGTKLAWMLDLPGVRARAERGELCFGTVDSWLIWNLCAAHPHVTDPTNASRTMLMNLHTAQWDDELLRILDIPRAVLPEIRPTSGVVGTLAHDVFDAPDSPVIPVAAMAGDQQSALFGQTCYTPGMVKATYGTGAFVLMHTGKTPVPSANRLLTTVAWQIGPHLEYALEGSVFMAGAVIQWLRDELKILDSAAQSADLALSVPDTQGVVLVPAFTGLGAPYWDMDARGTLLGLTRGAGRPHIVRAALESIAYQTMDVISAMCADASVPIQGVRVDGGASVNPFLVQFQADMLNIPVVRPRIIETTALGAAMLAGLATGFWADQEELCAMWREDAAYAPRMPEAERASRVRLWKRAVERAMGWAKP